MSQISPTGNSRSQIMVTSLTPAISRSKPPRCDLAGRKNCKVFQCDPLDLIQTYFNFCWGLFFSPFFIESNGKLYKLRWNSLQKAICWVIHSITAINAFLEIHCAFEARVEYFPTTVFMVAERIAAACSCTVFIYHVWFKAHRVLELLQTMHNGTVSISRKPFHKSVMIFCLLRLSLSMIYVLNIYLSLTFTNLEVKPALVNFKVAETMYKLYQRESPDYDNVTPWEQTTTAWKAITMFCVIATAYYSVWLDCISVLSLFSALIAYSICSDFTDSLKLSSSVEMLENEKSQTWIPRKLLVMQRYYQMKQKLTSLNNLTEYIFLVSFCSLVAFFSGIGISLMMIHGTFFSLCQLAVYLALYMATLLLAADANHKLNGFKEWLLLHGHGETVQDVFEYLQVSTDQLGVNGGKFFVVSYGFLGSSLSVLLTYCIIMIDFERITILPGQNITEIIGMQQSKFDL